MYAIHKCKTHAEQAERSIIHVFYLLSYVCLFINRSLFLCYRPVQIIPENAEEVSLMEMDPEYESRRQHRRHDAYGDEDGPTRNVQCASH